MTVPGDPVEATEPAIEPLVSDDPSTEAPGLDPELQAELDAELQAELADEQPDAAGAPATASETALAGAPAPDLAARLAAGLAAEPAADPALVAAVAAVATDVPAPRRTGIRGFLGRLRSPFRRIPHPPLRSRRGWFVVVLLLVGFGATTTLVAATAVGWTETADFCGRCHTMGPELKAYALSPHRSVACAECHVEPGIPGWIKAKVNGTRQLVMIMTNTFPTPIPAPDHADLPPTSATCQHCHDVKTLNANGGPVKLILQERFRQDEPNTRDTIALVLRPTGFGGTSATRGVHWHVDQEVDYLSSDPRAQTIDYVSVHEDNGEVEEFIASKAVSLPTNVDPDIERLKTGETLRRMNCIDCHNRVGHGLPTPDQAIDNGISTQAIDRSLPYIKKEASEKLAAIYPNVDQADAAIDAIRGFYETNYPLVAKVKAGPINTSIDALKVIYRLVATPEMRVSAATYPDNLGHQSAPGCFRCHDGAHYLVKDGTLTKESIPSACATCHTFPQIGATNSGVLIGERPPTHDDKLWVFNHKSSVSSLDPASSTCGACHTRTYCENCHNTKAVQVPHDDMVYNHAEVIKKTGSGACFNCHQPVYCSQCHGNDDVSGSDTPSAGASGEPSAQPSDPPSTGPSGGPSIQPSSQTSGEPSSQTSAPARSSSP